MHRKKLRIAGMILSMVIIIYFAAVNVLVSAALVPSFMEKLDSFRRITELCYSEQVQTTDIMSNRSEALRETDIWLNAVNCRKLSLESSDGYTLIAEEFIPEEESHKWVLILHGYTGWKEEMYQFAYWYYGMGYHVVVPDLRCQGESEGDFIGMGWTDHYDCMGWLQYMIGEDNDAQIVIHGQSMGASTALIMTGDKDLPENVRAVVSDCAYTDAYSMFGDKVRDWFSLPAFPIVDSARLILCLRGGYDLKKASALDAVRKSETPTLFIHGAADAMISADMAYELYSAANCDKELLIVEDAGHAQSQDKDPERYYGAIEAFLTRIHCIL